jgi:hypothetical protein
MVLLRICIPAFALLVAGIATGQTKNPLSGPDPMSRRLSADSVPPVTEWRGEDTEGKVTARTAAAIAAGPDAMEKLGHHLLTAEAKDGDGRYTMPYFYRELASPKGRPQDIHTMVG